MSRSLTLVFAILLAGPSGALGQVSLRHTYIDRSLITASGAPAGPQPAEAGFNVSDVQVAFPLYSRESQETGAVSVLENTFLVRRQTFSYEWPAGNTEYKPDEVFGLAYGLTWVQSLGRRWQSVAMANGGAFSDMEDFGSDDLLFEGGVILVRRVGQALELGAGPMFTYAFGNPRVIPVPYVRFSGRGNVLIDVSPPRYALVAIQPTPRLTLGVAARSVYSNYNIGDAAGRDAAGEKTSVVFSDITVGLESTIRVTSMVSFDAGMGTTLHRTFKINDHLGDRIVDRGLENTWVASFGLSVGSR